MPGARQQFNEERYKSVVRFSNPGVWEHHTHSGFLLYISENFEIPGMEVKDYTMDGSPNLKETWLNPLHHEDRDHAASKFDEYLKNGPQGMYESFFRMKHSNGNLLWKRLGGRALSETVSSMGQPTVGTHLNITDLNNAFTNSNQEEQIIAANNTEDVQIEYAVVTIITTDNPGEVENCYEPGNSNYIAKPLEYEDFVNAIRQFGLFLAVVQIPQIKGIG